MGSWETFERITFIMIWGFALVGAFMIATALHELSHERDFKPYVTEDFTCLLAKPKDFKTAIFNWDAPAAYYLYSYNHSDNQTVELVNKIGKNTEKKAYFISFIILLIFMFCTLAQWINRMENRYTKLLAKHLNSLNNLNIDREVNEDER